VVELVREGLALTGADAWLAYDFAGSNPPVREALGLAGAHLTRRLFYLVPRKGEPLLIAHRLEAEALAHLPGRRALYARREELLLALAEAISRYPRLALTYVPAGEVPYVSRVDAGTVELLRGLGAELVSDAPVLLLFARWSEADLAAHRRAVKGVEAARERALSYLRERLPDRPPGELELQSLLIAELKSQGLVFDHPPIVAFGEHASLPHYAPSQETDRPLREGDVVLLDIWAREPEGPYADVTWMAAWKAGEAFYRAFHAVAEARDRVVRALKERRSWRGFELDRLARGVLERAGYKDAIRHRTGHSLGKESPHGYATHLDDYETRDTRPLIPGLAFTVEPGVYPGPFGVRSEINVYLSEEGPVVTTAVQHAPSEL